LQDFLPLTLCSSSYGNLEIPTTSIDSNTEFDDEIHFNDDEYSDINIIYTDEGFMELQHVLPVLTYVAGHALRVGKKSEMQGLC
jgi:hypothetical protein